jgi:hypothetical protein
MGLKIDVKQANQIVVEDFQKKGSHNLSKNKNLSEVIEEDFEYSKSID